MSQLVKSDNFVAEYFDDDVEHGCPAKWYVSGRSRDGHETSRDLADYAEYVCDAYVGTGGEGEWELDPETMMRHKLTVQEALASYERAYELYQTYNGCYPESAIYERSRGEYRHPTDSELYGI